MNRSSVEQNKYIHKTNKINITIHGNVQNENKREERKLKVTKNKKPKMGLDKIQK